MKMRKTLALLLAALMTLSMAACGQKGGSGSTAGTSNPGSSSAAPAGSNAPSGDVAMQYMAQDELDAVLGDEGYLVVDVRKAADYETSHIPGAVSADMDAVISGEDVAAGVVTMEAATDGLDDTLVVICYSGKRYAQATTNTLAKLGYDMSKVYTLEGGFKGWSETYPDTVEP